METQASHRVELTGEGPIRFVVTRQGDTVSFYVSTDATSPALTFTLDESFASADTFRLYWGVTGDGDTGTAAVEGTVGAIGVYEGVLSAEEIAALLNPDTPLDAIPEPTALALLALGAAGASPFAAAPDARQSPRTQPRPSSKAGFLFAFVPLPIHQSAADAGRLGG